MKTGLSPLKPGADALLYLELPLLALLLPAVLLMRPVFTPLLLLLPALWVLRRLSTGRFVPVTPLNSSLLLLLFMVLVSLYATYDLAFSLPKVAGLLFGVALFYAVASFAGRSERTLWWMVILFLGFGLAVALISLLIVPWQFKLPFLSPLVEALPFQRRELAGSSPVNPNEVAGVLLWFAPLATVVAAVLVLAPARMMAGWSRWQRVVTVLITLLTALIANATLLLTQSRGGLLGMLLTLALLLLFSLRRRPRLLLLLFTLLVVVGIVGVLQFREPLLSVAAPVTVGEAGAEVLSLAGREEIWNRALFGIQDFSFTGMGMGTFRQVVHVLYPLFLISPQTDIAHAHNHLLQTALDLGLPGLIAYLGIWIGLVMMLYQSWRRAPTLWLRTLSLGFAASLLAYFVYGLADAVALGARPGFLFWMLLGLITALYLVSGNAATHSPHTTPKTASPLPQPAPAAHNPADGGPY